MQPISTGKAQRPQLNATGSLLLLSAFLVSVAFWWFWGADRGGRMERYSAGGSFIGGCPSISPDGSVIVYSSPRTGNGDIYKVPPHQNLWANSGSGRAPSR